MHSDTYGSKRRTQTSTKRVLSALGICAAAVVLPVAAWSQTGSRSSPKLSSELKKIKGEKDLNIIVRYRSTPTQRDRDKFLEKEAAVVGSYDRLKTVAYRVNSQFLEGLATDPEILYVSPDREVKAHALSATAETTGSYIAAAYNLSGVGVGIAVIDSGVSNHPDLKANDCRTNRVIYNQSFVSGDNNARDEFGHGTHVAAIIAGNGLCTGTSVSLPKITGIAPSANIINLRVLDENGIGTDTAVLAAINRAIEIKANYNIRVINLSIGRTIRESYTQDPLAQAVETATKAGILVVTSAGNDGRNRQQDLDGYGSVGSPANDPLVLTVGATSMNGTPSRFDDVLTSYSSKGPSAVDRIVKPDLVAPGNAIAAANVAGSTLLRNYPQNVIRGEYPSNKYFQLSGTSMASPMAAGAAALLFQKSPLLTPGQVKARLMRSASQTFPAATTYLLAGGSSPLVVYYEPLSVGAGYLDILAALNDSSTSTVGAVSPALVRNGTRVSLTDPTTATARERTDWAAKGSELYGALNVSASTLLGGHGKAWGESSIRGNAILWGDSVLAGDTSLWGGSGLWRDTIGRGDTESQ